MKPRRSPIFYILLLLLSLIALSLPFLDFTHGSVQFGAVISPFGFIIGIVGVLLTLTLSVFAYFTYARVQSIQKKLTEFEIGLKTYESDFKSLELSILKCKSEGSNIVLMNYTFLAKYYDELEHTLADDLKGVLSKLKKEVLKKRAIYGLKSKDLDPFKRQQCAYDLLELHSSVSDKELIRNIYEDEECEKVKNILYPLQDTDMMTI